MMSYRGGWRVVVAAFGVATACGPSLGEGSTSDEGGSSTAADTASGTQVSADGPQEGDDGVLDETGPAEDGIVDDTGAAPLCGNGLEELGEDCDDGNQTDEDGCNADCRVSGSLEWMATPDGAASLQGNDIVVNPAGGVTVSTVTDEPQTVLTRYTAQGDELWTASGPPDMVSDALAATSAGQVVWTLRRTHGPTEYQLQGFDDGGSLVWTLLESPEVSLIGLDAGVGLADGEAAFGGGGQWELRVDASGANTFASSLPGGGALVGLATYFEGTLALAEPPTRAFFREGSASMPSHTVEGLPPADGGPFVLPGGHFGYLTQGEVGSAIVVIDSSGLEGEFDAPGRAPSIAATSTPTGRIVTLTGAPGESTVYKWTHEGDISWSTPVPEGMHSLVSDESGAIYVLGTVSSDDGFDALILKLRP